MNGRSRGAAALLLAVGVGFAAGRITAPRVPWASGAALRVGGDDAPAPTISAR